MYKEEERGGGGYIFKEAEEYVRVHEVGVMGLKSTYEVRN